MQLYTLQFVAFTMAVATYAHLVLWNTGIASVFINPANVVGCAVYGLAALIVMWFGPGKYTVFTGEACGFGAPKRKLHAKAE
jgi:hypothetical protein